MFDLKYFICTRRRWSNDIYYSCTFWFWFFNL